MRTIWIILLLFLAGTTQATPGTDTTQVNRFSEFCSTTLKSKIDSITKEYQQKGKLNDYSLFVDYGESPSTNIIAEKTNGYPLGISLTDPRVIEFKQNLTALNNASTTYKVVYVNICAWNVIFTKTVFGDTSLDAGNFKNFLKPGNSNFDEQYDNSKSKARSVITTAFPDTPANLLFIVDCEFKFWHLNNPDYAANMGAPLKIILAERSYLSFYPYHFNNNISPAVKSEYERIFKICYEYIKGKEYPVQYCANCHWLYFCYEGIKKGLEKYKAYDNILSIRNRDSMLAHFSANFGSDASMYKALSLQQIIHVLKVLATGYFDDNPTNIMLNCMINCRDDGRKQMLDSIAFSKLYDGQTNLQRAIFLNISGDNLAKYLVATAQIANKVFPNYNSEVDAIKDTAYIKLKPGGFLGSAIYNRIDNATGNILLANLSQAQFVYKHPFKKVLVTITEDYSYRNFTWSRGEYKNVPAILAYAIFNHEDNQRLLQYLRTAVDVGLLFIGAGEVKYFFSRSAWGLLLRDPVIARKVISGFFTMKFASDIVIRDVVSDVLRQSTIGQNLLGYYEKFSIWTDMSYMGIAGLKSIYRSIKTESRQIFSLKTINGNPNTTATTLVDDAGNESFRAVSQSEITETNEFLSKVERKIEEQTGFIDDTYLIGTAFDNAYQTVRSKLSNLLQGNTDLLKGEEQIRLIADLGNKAKPELVAYLKDLPADKFEQGINAWKRLNGNPATNHLRNDVEILKSIVNNTGKVLTHIIETDIIALQKVTTVPRSGGSRAINNVKNLVNENKALVIAPASNSTLAEKVNDYVAAYTNGNSALQGELGEEIAEIIAKELNQGGDVLNIKINNSGNGFDVLSFAPNKISPSSVRVYEAKPLSATSVELPSTVSGGTQMSSTWIDNNITLMQNHATASIRGVGNIMRQNMSKIEGYVVTVDKDLKQVIILKLDNF